MTYKFRSLLSLDEDKVSNDTESGTDEAVKGNGTLVEENTDDNMKAVTGLLDTTNDKGIIIV